MDQLEVRVGFASETGKRNANEDYCAAREAEPGRAARELVATMADGVGGGPGGRLAAETTVRGFIDGYFGLPETLGVERAAARSLAAMNRWVCAQGRQDPGLRGMATTFSALILRGRSAHIVHLGDSRVYRLRGRSLQRLTRDHVHPQPDLQHVVFRAVGLEDIVRADSARHDLRQHDRFLLCSDGIHGTLNDAEIGALLAARGVPDQDARFLVERALEAGSQDNVSAMVIDVLGIPASERADLELEASALPIVELPNVGDIVDGFRLIERLSEGRYSRLFYAEDTAESRDVILKFPHPRVGTDASVRAAFVRESWVAQQVKSPYVVDILGLPDGRQSRLYVVMPYYRGETVEARLLRQPPLSLREGVEIGVKLGRAIYALNRLRIIHRDIKPENVLLENGNAGLKLIDLGAARLPATEENNNADIPGTPSYMAPELLNGAAGDERSEVYALGVTLYRALTGHYPYGEVEAFSHPRFGRRTPLSRYRPDLPAWLDATLGRAVAVKPEERHGDALELALELEHNLAQGPVALIVPRLSLYERNPLRFWQIISFLLLIALIVALAAR